MDDQQGITFDTPSSASRSHRMGTTPVCWFLIGGEGMNPYSRALIPSFPTENQGAVLTKSTLLRDCGQSRHTSEPQTDFFGRGDEAAGAGDQAELP